MSSFEALEKLSACLARLPGIGRKTAERMAIRLIRNRDNLLGDMIFALSQARESICCCSLCGSVTLKSEEPCRLCTSPDRDPKVLCVVEDPGDILAMERSGAFRGRYHALMGKLSPMKGEGPSELRVKSLVARIGAEGIQEIILALSTDVEGDSTCSFIAEILRKMPVRITRLAFGLPAGSGISYSDPVTLDRAMKGRQGVL